MLKKLKENKKFKNYITLWLWKDEEEPRDFPIEDEKKKQ